MPPLSELQPRRVCLIKPSALGDVVQTLPVLTMFRQRWPEAHLAWVINESLAGILEGHPDLNQVIPFQRARSGLQGLAALADIWRTLRRQQFDLTVDLQGLLRSAVMTWATRAPKRVGFSNAREGAVAAYTDRVFIPTRDLPALEKYRLVAEALGCQGAAPAARLGINAQHRQFVAEQLHGLPRPVLAIHPGAAWETKRWPADSFAQLAQRAQGQFGASIVLLGSGDDRAACLAIAGRLRERVAVLAGRTNLLQLAAVCQAADVFLSGDTGPMHLAAAMGTRVVSVFTCTSPLRAGPRGQEHRIVSTRVPCASSYFKRCRSMVCMQELTPDRVWPVLSWTLEEVLAAPRQDYAA